MKELISGNLLTTMNGILCGEQNRKFFQFPVKAQKIIAKILMPIFKSVEYNLSNKILTP